MSSETNPLLTAVITATKDILKFKIIQSISTGDKTYDSLIQTLLLSIMSAVFGMFSISYFKTKYMIWQYKRNLGKNTSGVLTQENSRHWELISKKREETFIYRTWYLSGNDSFTIKFCEYFIHHLGWRLNKMRVVAIDTKTFANVGFVGNSSAMLIIKEVIKKIEYTPMFVLGDTVAGCCIYNDILMFYTDDIKTLNILLKNISEYKSEKDNATEDTKAEEVIYKSIYPYKSDNEYTLYPDRSLNMFVSRYKPKIKNLLDNFIKANSEGSDYGGFGTYNLGFMLHGKPGTGKTMLIKAVCNYLKRHAYIIDMRKVKNKAEFESIFYNTHEINDHVYVLDEFDCVQDAIKDRSLDVKEGPSTKGDILHQRKLELLTLLMQEKQFINTSKKTENAENVSNPIQDELNKINKEITDHENSLSLDTILTVLDGMIEVRGRVIIATTNFIDNIDKALLRDGRFDLKVKLDTFNSDEIRELLNLMFTNKASDSELKRLNTIKLTEDVYTPTQLINLAISYGSLSRLLDHIKLPNKDQ